MICPLKRLAAAAACLALAFSLGCKKDDVGQIKPKLVFDPAALTFSACPKLDAQGQPVPDVFPDTKIITLRNQGNVSGEVVLSFTPANGPFSLAPDAGPFGEIGAQGSLEIPVQFSPTKSGDVSGTITAQPGAEGADAVSPATLSGNGILREAHPTLVTAPQNDTGDGVKECTVDSSVDDCTLSFPGTLYSETLTRTIVLRNAGCPALRITSVSLEPVFPGSPVDFTIVSPAQLPTVDSPLVLSPAEVDEVTFQIKFTPTDDGSGNSFRDAVLKIVSNDPVTGAGVAQPSLLSIRGEGLKPDLVATPGSCDFSAASEACGNSPRIENQARFTLRNDGNAPVKIDSVSFANGGISGRFAIGSMNPTGQTVQVGGSTVLTVTHNQMPIYVTDSVVISATVVGGAAGSGGRVTLPVYGGVKPCITTDPANALSFENPTATVTAKPLTVRNGAGCGTLIISGASISDGAQFFSLMPAVGSSQLNAGDQTEMTVQYRLPAIGGSQTGTLRIVTNDRSVSDSSGAIGTKEISLQSSSVLDPNPEAFLTICKPADLTGDANCTQAAVTSQQTSVTVRLSEIMPNAMGERFLTLSGVRSTDTAPGTVAGYRFSLVSPTALTGNLANHATRISSPTTQLKLSGQEPSYTVRLVVFDNRDKQSAGVTVVINVLQ